MLVQKHRPLVSVIQSPNKILFTNSRFWGKHSMLLGVTHMQAWRHLDHFNIFRMLGVEASQSCLECESRIFFWHSFILIFANSLLLMNTHIFPSYSSNNLLDVWQSKPHNSSGFICSSTCPPSSGRFHFEHAVYTWSVWHQQTRKECQDGWFVHGWYRPFQRLNTSI